MSFSFDLYGIKTCYFDTDLSVKYLFYDEIDNKPMIFQDQEYNIQFKQFVILKTFKQKLYQIENLILLL